MREIDAPDVVTRLGQHLSLSQLDGFEMLVEASEVNVRERLQELIGLGHGQSYCVRPLWQAALGRSGQICAHHPGLDAEEWPAVCLGDAMRARRTLAPSFQRD